MKKLVKFIILNEKYQYISEDKDVKEIHKLKTKYPANTFVRIPIGITKNKINILTEDANADGYVVISKHDYVEQNPKNKQNAKLRLENCKKACVEAVKKYNK